jgi:hypothetical protein
MERIHFWEKGGIENGENIFSGKMSFSFMLSIIFFTSFFPKIYSP